MFLPSLPAMMAAFGSDAATAQLTVTLFLAGLAASQLGWGPLSDRPRSPPGAPRRPRTLRGGGNGLRVRAHHDGLDCGARRSGARRRQRPVIARAIVRDLYEPERA